MLSKFYKKNILILTAVVIGLTVSCNQDPAGIFATIEATQAVDLGNNMPDNALILALAEYDGQDSHRLYAATGRQLMRRTYDLNSDWTAIEKPGSADGVIDLVFTAEGQAAALFTKGSSIEGLYTADGDDINSGSYSSNRWNKENTSSISGTPRSLFTADNKLFMATRETVESNDDDDDDAEPFVFRLYWRNNDTWENITFAETSTEIRGVAENAGTYYVLTRSQVFEGNIQTELSLLSEQPSVDDADYTALLIDPAESKMLITTSEGVIAATDTNTISWSNSNTLKLSSDSVARLTSIAKAPSDLGSIYIVGVREGGIAFLQGDTLEKPADTDITNTNFAGSKLRTTSVTGLLTSNKELDGNQVIFAGSAGNGLWRGRVEDTTTIRWGQE